MREGRGEPRGHQWFEYSQTPFFICPVLDCPPNQHDLQVQRLITLARSGLILPWQEQIKPATVFIACFFLILDPGERKAGRWKCQSIIVNIACGWSLPLGTCHLRIHVCLLIEFLS